MTRKAWIATALAVGFASVPSLPALAVGSRECTELCDCNDPCSKLCSFSFSGPFNHTCAEVGLCVGGYDCGGFAAGGKEKTVRADETSWLATRCAASETPETATDR